MLEDIVKRTLEVLPRYGNTFWALLATLFFVVRDINSFLIATA
ncbi:MAG: hypothetical protein ABJH07_23430 [Sedimentitalea sp.]